jgi:serine/threonine protein kinase
MTDPIQSKAESELNATAADQRSPETVPDAAAGHDTAAGFGPPRTADEIGTLGKFSVLKEIGRGGMGSVYLAYDEKLKRKLAIKVMLPRYADNAEAKERFLREARVTAGIKHDHIVTVYEADEVGGVPFIAMEYLQGMPLFDYLRQKKPIGLAQAVRVGREVAAGLSAAHKRGLIHRDIKPANIWLEAPNGRVKILDFGLAKPMQDAGPELTHAGAVLGTPAYMAPEQAEGKPTDHRADLFSLGVVLYRLLAGQLPFPGDSTMAVLMALGTKNPPPIRELNPQVPDAVAELVTDLLRKDPAARPASADEVLTRLKAADRRDQPRPGGVADSGTGTNVVPVPIPVPEQAESAFAHLDEEPTVLAASRTAATVADRRRGRLAWAGVSAILLIVVLVVLSSALKPPPVKETTGKPPEKPVERPAVVKSKPPAPPPVEQSPDRRAATWAISVGGTVRVNGTLTDVTAAAGLPAGDFELTFVKLEGNAAATDQNLAAFAGCTNLLELKLEGTPVTDAGLAHFKDGKRLFVLGLSGTAVTDAGVATFKDCRSLTVINLAATPVTDAGLKPFEGFPDLREVWLYGTKVTDAGLKSFKNCRQLSRVELNDTAVTDAGLTELAGRPALRLVEVKQTKVTAAGVAALAAARPECRVVWDGGSVGPMKE